MNLTAQERIYTPELFLPANGVVNQMPDVVLDWDAVTGGNTGIIQYDIQLDIDPAFPAPVNYVTEFLSAVQTSNLIFGQSYYWRVRARDGSNISDWSETWSFRVILRVTLTNPTEAATTNDTVRIKWSGISGLTEYDYQFDTTYYWKVIASGQTSNLSAISVVDDNHAWIAGAGGLILFFDGNSWTEQESGISTDLNSMHFLDASNGWAVGKGGQIIHYDGTSWTSQTSGTTNDLAGVYMADASNGWAVGKSGIVRYYNGTEWTIQDTATSDLNEVFAFDPNHVWAVGKSGLVIFYNGTSWAPQETGSSKEFLSVSFTSADQGWAVGRAGSLMKFTEGAWKNYESSIPQKDLNSIYFTGPDNGYAVGASGTLLQFDGKEWYTQSSTTTTNLNAVGFSGITGFIAGETGILIKYNDNAFSSPMAAINPVPGANSSVKVIDLLFGTQYFWRVRGKHSLDISSWSGARSFVTRAAVQLDKPTDNSTDQNLDQLLKWKNQMSKMVSYEIQVDDDATYGSPIFMETTEIQINSELLKFGVLYSWRVRALHAFDTSDWSTSWKFTTVNSVILVTPADADSNVKVSPLLTWEALTGITGYQILVDTSDTFEHPRVNEIVPVEENSLIVPVVLGKDTVYYWRVRAINGLDTSGWSNTWSFKTLPPVGIDEPGLTGKLNVYPNPAINTVYIQLKDKINLSLQLSITDLVGKTVLVKEIRLDSANKNVPIDVSTLQNGIYLIRIADKENTFTKKLIIRR
jgi:photosystem II stability/assembly factor-like uncharacterized protein